MKIAANHKIRLAFFSPDQPRQIASIKRLTDGSILIALNGGNTEFVDGVFKQVKIRYVSVHTSNKSSSGNLIKQTTRFTDGTQYTNRQFTEALSQNKTALLYTQSPGHLSLKDYELGDSRKKVTPFSLGAFDPDVNTPVIHALLMGRESQPMINEDGMLVWFTLPEFRLGFFYHFHAVPSDGNGICLFPKTFAAVDGKEATSGTSFDDEELSSHIRVAGLSIARDRILAAKDTRGEAYAHHVAHRLRLRPLNLSGNLNSNFEVFQSV